MLAVTGIKGRAFSGAKVSEKALDELPRLGHQIWYETGPIEHTWVEAQMIVKKHGFDPKLLEPTKAKKAYCLAVNSIQQASRWSQVRVKVEPVKETKLYIRHQVTVAEVVGNGGGVGVYEVNKALIKKGEGLGYQPRITTHFDKESEQITFAFRSNKASDQDRLMQRRIKEAFERYKKKAYRQTLLDFAHEVALSWQCIPLRSRGGIWFVPTSFDDEVMRMEKVFEDFAEGMPELDEPAFYRLPMPDTVKWRKSVSKMLDTEMQGNLKDLADELESMIEMALASGSVKEHVLQKRYARFREQAQKVQAYESLLNYKAEKVHEDLQGLTEKVNALHRGDVQGLRVQMRKKKQAQVKAQGKATGLAAAKLKIEKMVEAARKKGDIAKVIELSERLHTLEELEAKKS